jgi:hypothetical protein
MTLYFGGMMLKDFRKSIQLILSERIASPFSGAFIFSWFIWNWKLIYVLVASDSEAGLADRIILVENNYINLFRNLWYPLLSAIFLVTIYPFVTTGSLWAWLKFKKLQLAIKNNIEGQQLLTIEQSLALRLEVQNQENKFQSLLKSKDDEIEMLNFKLTELKKTSSTMKSATNVENKISDDLTGDEIDYLMKNGHLQMALPEVIQYIQGNFKFSAQAPKPEAVGVLTAYDLIKKRDGSGIYDFTPRGKQFLKHYYKET